MEKPAKDSVVLAPTQGWCFLGQGLDIQGDIRSAFGAGYEGEMRKWMMKRIESSILTQPVSCGQHQC